MDNLNLIKSFLFVNKFEDMEIMVAFVTLVTLLIGAVAIFKITLSFYDIIFDRKSVATVVISGIILVVLVITDVTVLNEFYKRDVDRSSLLSWKENEQMIKSSELAYSGELAKITDKEICSISKDDGKYVCYVDENNELVLYNVKNVKETVNDGGGYIEIYNGTIESDYWTAETHYAVVHN